MSVEDVEFFEDEKVLCYHSSLLYEAKILSIFKEGKSNSYLVHYVGWSKKWDEVVDSDDILKLNSSNLQKKTELELNHPQIQNSFKLKNKKKQLQSSKKGLTPTTSKKSRNLLLGQKNSVLKKIDPIKVIIPDNLKPILYDDFKNVTNYGFLCKLPAKKSVNNLLEEFVKGLDIEHANKSHIKEFKLGVKSFFDHLLNTRCLYPQERLQYSQALSENPNKTNSELYGGIHLLRFFTKIGSFLAYSSMEAEQTSKLLYYIHDFLAFMDNNLNNIFSQEDYLLSNSSSMNSTQPNKC